MRALTTALCLLAALLAPAALSAGALDARAIMERVDARDDGNNAEMDMDMTLIDRQGRQRLRSVKSFRRYAGPDNRDSESILFFLAPADVKDTAFLTMDYHDVSRDDDQWLYLPALKKTKRIAASDKSGSFMGTDFTYADMTKRNLDFYDYSLLKEEVVNGHPTWVIEAIPNNDRERAETGYGKSVLFVRQDNFMVIRAVNWVDKGGRLKYMDVRRLEQIDGIWIAAEMAMTTRQGRDTLHQTVMHSRNIRFNQPLTDELFSLRSLEKGL